MSDDEARLWAARANALLDVFRAALPIVTNPIIFMDPANRVSVGYNEYERLKKAVQDYLAHCPTDEPSAIYPAVHQVQPARQLDLF
ncbi:MAG: hypothetical protein KKA73_28200 [Chloroflexi bacterium]|nr:hypothetical protein [Chloroflexota bacterium]MBU1751577.1 hypothetical protein [Chloroflexota bacterium]